MLNSHVIATIPEVPDWFVTPPSTIPAEPKQPALNISLKHPRLVEVQQYIACCLMPSRIGEEEMLWVWYGIREKLKEFEEDFQRYEEYTRQYYMWELACERIRYFEWRIYYIKEMTKRLHKYNVG